MKYLGNTRIRDKRLAKETDLKKGSSLDPYAVEEGRRKIEEYYQSKGYNDVRVIGPGGNKPGDRGAIYMINEGESQKIKKTVFVGNTITSGQRLKTQIESKPPILGLFKGQYSEKKVDRRYRQADRTTTAIWASSCADQPRSRDGRKMAEGRR